MSENGYLKIPDIDGESQKAGHEGEIDILSASWSVSQATSASTGSGRTRGRGTASDFTFVKEMDASSPYIALACLQGKAFDECVYMARKDSGEEHLDYLKITMTDCIITNYSMSGGGPGGSITETLSISCEHVTMLYTEQATDHSAGGEHEIEYNLVAGA